MHHPNNKTCYGIADIHHIELSLCVIQFLFNRFQADPELAEAIEADFYRFEPYLRHALQELVAEGNQGYVIDLDKGQR